MCRYLDSGGQTILQAFDKLSSWYTGREKSLHAKMLSAIQNEAVGDLKFYLAAGQWVVWMLFLPTTPEQEGNDQQPDQRNQAPM